MSARHLLLLGWGYGSFFCCCSTAKVATFRRHVCKLSKVHSKEWMHNKSFNGESRPLF